MSTPPVAPNAMGKASHARRIYARPPVVEAVVDIQVVAREGLEVGSLARIQAGHEAEFPDSKSLLAGAVQFDLASAEVVTSNSVHSGYRISDTTGTRVVLSRREGFTYSRLAPYAPWETWSPEAQKFWHSYLSIAQPSSVRRIAVRYINRIEFPYVDGRKVRDYLTVFPETPEDLPKRIAGMMMRVELVLDEVPNGRCILSVGRIQPTDPTHVALLLDLDLVQTVDLSAEDGAVWTAVDTLHELENSLFESCVTDLSRELFA